jgi:hypothetical protein
MDLSKYPDLIEIKEILEARQADLKARMSVFRDRAKAEWCTTRGRASSELASLSGKVKVGANRTWARLRDGLDLSRRGEVASLAARVDELARKLSDYESHAAR